jgi:hypothetical protein
MRKVMKTKGTQIPILTFRLHEGYKIVLGFHRNYERRSVMKKVTRVILLIALLAYPSICVPSYLVQLTNGNQLIIHEYWEDGSQIKFYSYAGVVGVKKGLVREIKEANLPHVIEKPRPPTKWNDQVETQDKSASKYEKKRPLPDPRDKAFLEEKRVVMMKISAVCAAFREAKARNDRKQMQEERKKLLASQTKLSELLIKVRNVHGGQVPTWWDEPLPTD